MKYTVNQLEAMFNLCIAFEIPVENEIVILDDCNLCEMKVNKVDASYYEEAILDAFEELNETLKEKSK